MELNQETTVDIHLDINIDTVNRLMEEAAYLLTQHELSAAEESLQMAAYLASMLEKMRNHAWRI